LLRVLYVFCKKKKEAVYTQNQNKNFIYIIHKCQIKCVMQIFFYELLPITIAGTYQESIDSQNDLNQIDAGARYLI